MRVLLDDRELAVDRPTLARALEAGLAEAEAGGRVLIEAKLDGVAIPDDQLASPTDAPLEGDELRLVSANPHALVRTSLFDARDALDDALERQTRAADLILTGQGNEALGAMADALQIWQAVRDVVAQGSELIERTLGAGESFESDVRRLSELLTEIKRCLNAQDWAALADLLAYDLGDQGEKWKQILEEMAGQVEVSR
jgi:predicted transcriptional regulator